MDYDDVIEDDDFPDLPIIPADEAAYQGMLECKGCDTPITAGQTFYLPDDKDRKKPYCWRCYEEIKP